MASGEQSPNNDETSYHIFPRSEGQSPIGVIVTDEELRIVSLYQEYIAEKTGQDVSKASVMILGLILRAQELEQQQQPPSSVEQS